MSIATRILRAMYGVLLAAVAFGAHAEDPGQERSDAVGQTILLISILDPTPFHRHTGVTGLTSFGKELDGDTHLREGIHARLATMITEAGYRVAWEEVPDGYIKPFKRWSFIKRGWSKGTVKPEYAAWFREKMHKHGANAVVMLFPYTQWSAYGSAVISYSYGLATLMGDPPKETWLNSNIGAFVLNGESLEIMPFPVDTMNCGRRIDFGQFGADSIKNINATQLVAYNDQLIDLAAYNMKIYLSASNLFGIEREECPWQFIEG